MTEETLFHEALAKPASERAVFLDRACAGQPQLRAAVEALLSAHEASGGFLEQPAPANLEATEAHTPEPENARATESLGTGAYIPRSDDDDPGESPQARPTDQRSFTAIGTVIAGRYTLVEVIGEGGMGSLYLAEQSEPVKRQVALKLIKSGMDSRTVLNRFEAERQALALMDHPNIARIYDGGMTVFVVPPLGGSSEDRLKAELRAGCPYFVMELVHGIPITRFCDERRLGIRARLELFVSVCQAVQHAHQKGIIHRDLKPGNVLVTEVDGRPTPKVIDFGVAKATEQKLTDASLADLGLIVGTPAYMSPEQADPSSMDIDTRTDVYALGVILYELLVGSPPFDAQHFKRGAILEMLRMVREDEPQRPSTKLSSAAALPSIAANRDIEPAKLAKFLRGELDWLVMKALEKDRTRRYETANGFARDIQRYLADEPVEARPPSAQYRLQKFVRRNRGTVTAGAAVAAALLIGIVGFAWQAKIARDQRDRAVHAEDQTKKRADELQKVADYQAKMLQQIDAPEAGVKLMADLRTRHRAALETSKVPEAEKSARTAAFERELHAVNATDTAVALLDRTVLAPAVRTIETQFADQPLVDASLRTTLGVVYHTLGRPKEALALYQRAYALRVESLGEEHRDTLASRYGVGRALGELQKHSEAESTIRATLKAYQRVLGEDHHETLVTQSQLAMQMYYQGKYEESEAITRDVLGRRRRVLGPDHVDTLGAMNDLGMFLMNRGKYADAETVLREVVEAQRRVADSSVAGAISNLDLALQRQKKYTAAEPYLREALERRRRDQGEDHPNTLTDISNLAALLMDTGKLAEAEPLAKEALEKCRRIHGNEHSDTLKSMNIMGQVLFRQNKLAETEPYYREALATGRRVLGEEHPDTIIWTANLGFLLQRLGRIAEAEPYFREAVDKNRRRLGETHPYTLTMIKGLVDLLRQQGKPAEAEAYLREALEKVRRLEGEDHPETLSMMRSPVDLLRQQDKLAEAEGYSRGALEKVRRLQGEDHPDTLALIGILGGVLRDQGKLAEAEPYFQQAIEKSRRLHGEEHANTLLAILRMASLRVAQGKNAEAVTLLTPLEDKVRHAFPGGTGLLRHASLLGLLGKARAGLAKQPAEFTAAEANLLEAQAIFAKTRGEKDKETREWTQALEDFYTAWDKAAPGKGYDAKAAAWKAKLQPTKATQEPAEKKP